MYFKQIQINGFGKIKDKQIELNQGLNVIHGKNESGKSTFSNFIRGMFYGVSKNKEGNKFSDYERFKPWSDNGFGGKLSYDYDGKEYTIFRDFAKNTSKVYDEQGNDVTGLFNKDRSRGVEVGLAHLKLDEETFKNSLLVRQAETAVESDEQRCIIQKLTNMIQLGEEGTSYEKTKSKLEKMLLDEVGTNRTQNKPINVVNREIQTYTKMKDELLYNKERAAKIEDEMKAVKQSQIKADKSFAEAKSVYEVKKKYEDLLQEKRNAYDTAKKILEREKEDYEKSKKKRLTEGIVTIVILFALIVSLLIIFKQYVLAIASVPLCACFVLLYRELEKKDQKVFSELNFDITKEELNKKEQKELETLEKEGVRKSLFDRKAAALKELMDGYERAKNDAVLEEHKLQIENNSLKNDVIKVTEVEENLQAAVAKKKEIQSLENSIKLAISTLEESYEEIKQEIIPEITRLIKESVAKTTNGEYSDVLYNDGSGLLAQDSNGALISIDKLSIGTIDQIYLGFRLAIANRLENIPLILDETFVYYDEERLENILNTIAKMAEEKQIILLTCSDREINLLGKNRIPANFIEL